MLHRNNRMTRLITAALAIAAIAPTAAVARPIDQTGAAALWQRCAHGGTPYGGTAAAAPQSPANPKPIEHAKATAST